MEETLEDIANITNEDELESNESELEKEKQVTEENKPLEQVVEEENESQGFISYKKIKFYK